MPYLPEKFRTEIQKETNIEQMARYFTSLEHNNFLGAVNYLNYFILQRRVVAEKGKYKRYAFLAGWIGTMICCVLEVYRRIIGPYEDIKIRDSGDVL